MGSNKKFSLIEYSAYFDCTDNTYELIDGNLSLMPPVNGLHALIIYLVSNTFEKEINKLNSPWIALQGIGIHTGLERCRIPDLSVVTTDQIEESLHKTAILKSPPLLVVEVVSEQSATQDYRYKRSEYGSIGIPEYWIIDPENNLVTVLELIDGFYEAQEFYEQETIVSPLFPELIMTTEKILNPYSSSSS